MIDAGTSRAKARRAALGKSSTGKEQVAVEWEMLDAPSGQSSITSYHYFSSEKAIEIAMDQLRAGGFKGDDLSDLSSLYPDANPPEVELVVAHEEYNGKWSAKVRYVNSLGGLAMAHPLDETQAKAFAARMRGAIAAYDQARGLPAAARQPAPRPAARPSGPSPGSAASEPVGPWGPSDDDVPF